LHESYEASAILGQGVFETLKAISRLTLRSLKKRMVGEERPTPKVGVPAASAPPKAAAPPPSERARPAEDRRPAEPPRETIALAPPRVASAPRSPAREEPPAEIDFEPVEAAPATPEPPEAQEAPEEIAEVSFAESAHPEPSPATEVKHVRVGSNVDILAELERLRKNATSLSPTGRPSRRAASGISVDDLLANSLNHRKEVSRIFELEIPRRDLAAGQQVTVTLRFADRDNRRVGEEKSFTIPLETVQDLEKLLLSLKFQVFGK